MNTKKAEINPHIMITGREGRSFDKALCRVPCIFLKCYLQINYYRITLARIS